MKLTVEITPIPLERNYHGKRKNFLPEKSRVFRENFQWLLMNERRFIKQYLGALKVTLHFYKPARPTAKTRYGDIDNLAKAVLDACNGILWLDDSQIVELHGYKHKGEGKIEIEVVECT